MHAFSIVQYLNGKAQDSQHQPTDKQLVAIRYWVMDEHNYQNKGRIAPGDSIELFFDADKPDYISFVLGVVEDRADDGKVWGGYLSMRFRTQSPALLAMQQWPRTVPGDRRPIQTVRRPGAPLAVEEESRNRDIVLHWGQRNHREQTDVEQQFVSIDAWRDTLADLSEHGRLANLSTELTRLVGLEITVPRLDGLTSSLRDGCANERTTSPAEEGLCNTG